MSNSELKQQIVEQIDHLDDDQLETVLEIMRSFITEANPDSQVIELSKEQLEWIKNGQEDIKVGRYISQDELDQQDTLWLNEP